MVVIHNFHDRLLSISSWPAGTVLEKKAEVSKGSGSGETLTAGSHSGKEKEAPMFERQKGESVRDFFDRVDVEANVRIMESYRANRKMSDRRKRYFRSQSCMPWHEPPLLLVDKSSNTELLAGYMSVLVFVCV